MRLDEIRRLVIESDRDRDWHDIAVGSYFKDVPDVDENTYEWHHSMIVYRDDVDLAIQWGMPARGSTHITTGEQIWREHGEFPDPAVTVEFADVFWRGNLVDRVRLVSLDGGRALLPIGDQRALNYDTSQAGHHQDIEWEYSATTWELGLARLLDTGREFDRYLRATTMVTRD